MLTFAIRTGGTLINYGLRPFGLALKRTHSSNPVPPPMPLIIPNLPQTFFADCRVLSSRSDLLKALPQGGIVAEIGVADGDYSADLLTHNRPTILHLVDAWDSERYKRGVESVQSRFALEIASGSVRIHRGRSVDVLPKLDKKSFDWLYLDTSHTYADTSQELRLCVSLVKDGGRIAGHDFCTGNPYSTLPYGVIQAVYEFCIEYKWRFEYITLDGDGHFSFCLIGPDHVVAVPALKEKFPCN
jgi:predicted O-methyltransferase YrrM